MFPAILSGSMDQRCGSLRIAARRNKTFFSLRTIRHVPRLVFLFFDF